MSTEYRQEILQAEMQAWLIDAVINSIIGLAFGTTILLEKTSVGWIDRYIDQILVIVFSVLFIKDPLVLIKNGLRELLLAAPQREYAAPYEDKLLPLKAQLGVKNLALEIMRTGRRMWLTIRIDPMDEMVTMEDMVELKERLNALALEVYPSTHTEIILERI